MQLHPDTIYHIYNRGNNQQQIFFQERNYNFFMAKASNELSGELDFLAYCLMPNHFHFLVNTKPTFDPLKFSNAMRTMLSSYTRAIQKQEGLTGSLFQQNTKYKELDNDSYAHTCFHYIHQNALKAKLVSKMEDWPHHSFNEYFHNKSAYCNIELARAILTIPIGKDHFYIESYGVINDELTQELF
jgi:putative transposase